MNTNAWLQGFRHSSPYINAHRGRTVVLTMPGAAIDQQNFINIVHDIVLLSSLGVRLVVAFGARSQVQQRLQSAGLESTFACSLRVTTRQQLPMVMEAIGGLRAYIESQLSMGLVNSPMHNARIRVCSGNYVTAKPVGVLNGVDYGYTGKVRRIDVPGIEMLLDQGQIVLLPPLGYSPSGDVFNLSYEDVGSQVAAALHAEKLMIFVGAAGLLKADGTLLRKLSAAQAAGQLAAGLVAGHDAALLKAACDACIKGVGRAHIISYLDDGALLKELFTGDGSGTLVRGDSYEKIRAAKVEDVDGITRLIRPLEEYGVLVRRSPAMLETQISRFVVAERDGNIVGCAALYPYNEDNAGELYCFAVEPDCRRAGRGDELLAMIEQQARHLGLKRLFVLTTQTEHWFRERDFEALPVESLPGPKLAAYNTQRNAKVFCKAL